MGILDRIADRFDELVTGDTVARPEETDELGRARELAERGEHEQAAAAFGALADRQPEIGRAWLGLADALAVLDRFEPARDAYRRALLATLSVDDRRRAQAQVGRLYAKAQQWGRAIRELRKAADGAPDDASVLTALGRALIADGQSEGSDWLARAARLPGGTADLLAEAAAAKPNVEQALGLLREGVASAPADAGIRAALARHLMTMAVAEGRRGAPSEGLREALEEARTATAADPTNHAAWAVTREVNAAAGDYAAALAAARTQVAVGARLPLVDLLGLALGAEDRSAIADALAHAQPDEPGFAEAGAFLDGTLNDAGGALLARLAPTPGARRFVARALGPPPPPRGDVYALLGWAERLAARQTPLMPLTSQMGRALEAFDRPLLVAVMGEFNAGKSSFVNALAGLPIAPVGVTPTTATINVLRHGAGGGRAVYHDGHARDLAADAVAPFLRGLDDADAGAIRFVEVFAPIEALRRVEIVDTPGLNSLRPAHEKVARDFLVEADAIIWVFTAGQAAKATERDALALARAAGKRVLGVINKVDRAAPEEIDAVLRHVERELQDLVERVVPLSARAAVEARARHDDAALAASGLPAVEATLEASFFAQARELKRATAIAALRRFIVDARAAFDTDPMSSGGPLRWAPTREAMNAVERDLRSVIAAERVTLRARLDEAVRAAAFEVREFVRPRAWLFGEHSADPEDEAFLRDLLEDGVAAATAQTLAALRAALTPAESKFAETMLAGPHVARLLSSINEGIERFRAYARGMLEGAAAVFFRIDLPRIRIDVAAIRNALARWTPDPEAVLFAPLERALLTFATNSRAELDEREQAGEIAAIMRCETVVAPLDALAAALTALDPPADAATTTTTTTPSPSFLPAPPDVSP